eukprot:CAMPEP_0179046808 /NCGR_PEP_ID=MMETSP0796-20121207/18876_1 /TAXON_ID=73915 /ORGANISM="Pyrodinium bahamense, Strain pbaha01" /LENGTH=184 /DNA_ID=CAMNT_0020743241 /DNA_START=223 /DNA_END=774 /DNA_ORIENTATION=+
MATVPCRGDKRSCSLLRRGMAAAPNPGCTTTRTAPIAGLGARESPASGAGELRLPTTQTAKHARKGLPRGMCATLPCCSPASLVPGGRSASAEGLVPSFAQDIHDRLEGKPFGDLLPTAQTTTELRAGKLDDLLALFLGHALLDVSLLRAHVHHVLVVGDLHAQLFRKLLAGLLRVVRSVEVVA